MDHPEWRDTRVARVSVDHESEPVLFRLRVEAPAGLVDRKNVLAIEKAIEGLVAADVAVEITVLSSSRHTEARRSCLRRSPVVMTRAAIEATSPRRIVSPSGHLSVGARPAHGKVGVVALVGYFRVCIEPGQLLLVPRSGGGIEPAGIVGQRN